LSRLRALDFLGQRSTERNGVNAAIGIRRHRANFGKVRVVKGKGLILGCNSIENAVRLSTREQPALAVEHQPGDVSLTCGVVFLALACACYAEDAAVIACPRVKSSIVCQRERPDVFRFRVEIFRGLAALDSINLAVGRARCVDYAFLGDADSEDLRTVG